MATGKKAQKQTSKSDSLWRKPITLASFDTDDPLETLYRGREAGEANAETEIRPAKTEKLISKPAVNKTKNIAASKKNAAAASCAEQNTEVGEQIPSAKRQETSKATGASFEPKISEAELKSLLKIRSDAYHFTDLREILRGKSFDIYAYLRFLSNEAGVCKIKHLDLMKKLDISRPTLFKQGDWLVRLGLIEKRNVPGDHLGTSYTVHRLEKALPVSDALIRQLDSQIEIYRKEAD